MSIYHEGPPQRPLPWSIPWRAVKTWAGALALLLVGTSSWWPESFDCVGRVLVGVLFLAFFISLEKT